jgi:hypothetical protein
MIPNSTTSAVIGKVVSLTDQLARQHPCNLDVQIVSYMIHQLAKELAKPDALVREQPHRRLSGGAGLLGGAQAPPCLSIPAA